VLIPDERRRGNLLLYRRVLTDNGGRFGLRGIAPGEYKIFVVQPAAPVGAEEDPEFISQHESRAVSLSVAAGAATEMQLTNP
jgi:protocatechuate 3,4-dioxygenase beta subunit